jgi:phosphoribosyl-AMP cyclohydrolase
MEKQWKVFNKKLVKRIRFEREGFLIDVILQDCITGDVLFGASMTRETFLETIDKGIVVLFSKSRKERWVKGETSGNYLKVVSIMLNCEKNQLLIQVLPIGDGVCHKRDKKGKSKRSCFFRSLLKVEAVEIGGKYYRIKSGTKEGVNYYFDYGWLTQEELFNLRQIDPRYAP